MNDSRIDDRFLAKATSLIYKMMQLGVQPERCSEEVLTLTSASFPLELSLELACWALSAFSLAFAARRSFAASCCTKPEWPRPSPALLFPDLRLISRPAKIGSKRKHIISSNNMSNLKVI